MCTARDIGEIKACRATGASVEIIGPHQPGDYARKINYGVLATESPFLFQGADDLQLTRGWDTLALTEMERGAGVVGTRDLGNARTRNARHSTHSLISREYAKQGTIDNPDTLMHEGYAHNFVDDELVATARHRGRYRPSRAIVEHLHPLWRKAPCDDVYDLGQAGYAADSVLFQLRRELWEPGLAERRALEENQGRARLSYRGRR